MSAARPERRQIDRQESPPGAAAEAAMAGTEETEETRPHLKVAVEPGERRAPRKDRLTAALLLGTVGVVYGDIGTSPIYAFREAFHGALARTPSNVYGVLSLVTWSLILVVSIK